MKSKFFLIIFLIFFFSCKKDTQNVDNKYVIISDNIQYFENKQFLKIHSGSSDYKIPKEKLPLSRVIVLSTSLLGYFLELNEEEKIIGVADEKYIFSQEIRKNLDKKIADVGTGQKYDLEKIISLKPDAVFTNYIVNFQNSYEILKKNGIQVIFIDDYKETFPLEKSKILLLFGKLFGEENLAEKKYSEIEKNYLVYENLAKNTKEKPKILVNEMFGNQWFMPKKNSFAANLLLDAHADYPLENDSGFGSKALSFEEVLATFKNAEIWVNAGNYSSKKNLLAANPNYAAFAAFKTGKIYAQNKRLKGSANDFFESGVVRCDLVLRDYVKIFHPEIFPEDSLVYMKEIF